MEPKAKKLKSLSSSWEETYGCVKVGTSAVCTLCNESVTARTYNIERHYQAKHKISFSNMQEDEKVEYIKKRVLQYGQQRSSFQKFIVQHQPSTKSSFIASLNIAKYGKPFKDGEFLKNTFLECADSLFDDFKNKYDILKRIKEIPLSRQTVQRRIEDMSKDVDLQVKEDLLNCDVISLAIDESTDINNIARLAIVARYGFINSPQIHEEFCELAPMTGTTKGVDIFEKLMEFINFKNGKSLDLKNKLFSVTTDGAPAMMGKNVGFIKLLEKWLERPLLSFHCVIHEESLCAKASSKQLTDIMSVVVKIVNIIVARSSLVHRQFKDFLNQIESAYGDLLLHAEVRWLSRGKVLNRFISLIDAINIFLMEIGENYPQLNDKVWLLKLRFLADITNHFNELNLRLQGNHHTILKLFEEWKSFQSKLQLFESDIQTSTFQYFPLIKSISEEIDIANLDILINYIENIKEDFSSRFDKLKTYGPMFSFIVCPDKMDEKDLNLNYFKFLNIDKFSLELIDLKSSSIWQEKFKELRAELENTEDNNLNIIANCWSSLPQRFLCIKKVGFALLSAFGSSYSCEQIFSLMKFVLNSVRNKLTLENSDACIRLKLTKYQPDLEKLCKEFQHQGSH